MILPCQSCLKHISLPRPRSRALRDVPGVARRAAASSHAASGGRWDSDGDPPVNIAIPMENGWTWPSYSCFTYEK